MKLTERQKRFIDFFIELGNQTEAAKRSGYSKKTAYRAGFNLMQKPHIREAVDARLKELESKRIANAKEVMEFLTSSVRGDIEEEVIVVESEGDFVTTARKVKKKISAKERIKAAELLSKRYGLLTPDTQINITPIIISGEDDLDE